MRGDLAAEQGVAVGRGLCGDVRPHGAAGAGTVFDQDLLTEELAPLRPDDSRHDVDATPPGGKGTIWRNGRFGYSAAAPVEAV